MEILLFALSFLLVAAVIAIVQLVLRYRTLRNLQAKIHSSCHGSVFLLSEKFDVLQILPSLEAERFAHMCVDGNFLALFSEEFAQTFQSNMEIAKDKGRSPESMVRLSAVNGGDWYKISIIRFTSSSGTMFICSLEPMNDLMGLQLTASDSRKKIDAFRKAVFDVLWCIDIETRRVTLFNDVLDSRHGALSRPAGEYPLRDLVVLQDYLHFETRLNERVKNFVKYGADLGADHILNLRMIAPQHTSVWHALRGVILRDDNGRLLMYGSSHRLERLQFPGADPVDFGNMFSVVLNSSVYRIFWCDLDGRVLGGNSAYARDMDKSKVEELQSICIADFKGPQEYGMRFFYSHLSKMRDEKIVGPVVRPFSFPAGRGGEYPDVDGQMELIPMTNNEGQLVGGLFIYGILDEHPQVN